MSDGEDQPKTTVQTVDDLFDDDDDDSDDEEMADVSTNNNSAADTANSNTDGDNNDVEMDTGDEVKGEGEVKGEDEVKGEAGGSNSGDDNDTKFSTNNTAALFGSDDDSDEEDDEQIGETAATTTTTTTTSAKIETAEDLKKENNDEDEDDAEFNDDDNIVGKNRVVTKKDEPLDGGSDGQTGLAQQSANQKKVIEKQDLVVPDMPLPQFNGNGKSKKSFHITSLPKVVAIQPAPFSKDAYNPNVEEAEYKSRVHSMIRWRYKTSKDGNGEEKKERDEDTGKLIKESNATIVKWSDGSFGLRVGNEMFDMDEFSFLLNAKKSKMDNKFSKNQQRNNNNVNPNGPTSKDFLYLTQTASTAPSSTTATSSTQEPSKITILQAVKNLKSKFIPRPSSLHSAAHKQFALESKSRTFKRAKIQTHVSFIDPEKQKLERIRNKDDLMKQEKRSSTGSGGRRSFGGASGRRRVGYNRGYMEDDDDEYDTVNVRRLKKGAMDEDDMDYGDDDMQSEEEDEWSKRKKRGFESQRKNKTSSRKKDRFEDSDESNEEEEEFDDDDEDDDEGITIRKKASVANKRKAAFDDDDDDDDDSE